MPWIVLPSPDGTGQVNRLPAEVLWAQFGVAAPLHQEVESGAVKVPSQL